MDIADSRTSTPFNQKFIGVYLAASNGPITTEIQMRTGDTSFKLSSDAVDGSALGLDDTPFHSTFRSISGVVKYAMPVWSNLIFKPKLGFGGTLTLLAHMVRFRWAWDIKRFWLDQKAPPECSTPPLARMRAFT